MSEPLRTVNVGLIGLGTVGGGVARLIKSHRDEYLAAYGIDLKLTRACALAWEQAEAAGIEREAFTSDWHDVVTDPAVDIVVELIGGEHPATEIFTTAFENGKHVVSANKALLGRHVETLAEKARECGVQIKCEASCGGGIPIVSTLEHDLVGNKILTIAGILNGTTNYILSRMDAEGADYADVLADAQAKGYAEADPTQDLNGGDIRRKISTFCNVKPECVIENLTMPSLYQCPLMLHTGGLDEVVVKKLKLDVPPADLTEWKQVVSRIATRSKTCTIALVGKYVKLHDAYLSVMESLYHAGFENDSQVEIKWVESEDLTDQAACREAFADVDGIIVPGGFGDRGIEGMIQAAQYARENHVPYFGICLGMQIMVMEFARGVLGYKDANSSEFTPDGKHNVIALMADQQGNIPKGGTMRLGKYPCKVAPGTKMAECYGEAEIWERHRHRYEFNNEFRQEMQDAGLVISGTSPDGRLVETVELPGRDFHLGAQFHPEFKSRPNRAHPLFKAFIAAALKFRASEQRSLLHM